MKKYLALLLAAVMVLGCLAGCGNNDANTDNNQGGSENTDQPGTADNVGPDGRTFAAEQVYRGIYSSELTSLNYLSDGQTYNLVVGANCIDPLVENDSYGNVVPCGATSWESELETYTNADGEEVEGQKWTFHLREGQHWYDYQGNDMGEVTADDYVAAIRYVADAEMDCANSYLVEGWVRGAAERWEYTYAMLYADPKGQEVNTEDKTTEYAVENGVYYRVNWNDDGTIEYEEMAEVKPEDVMIEALDKYTVVYHLETPRAYFLTSMGFGCYWPAPASMLETWGKDFGIDNEHMYFNGAYILQTLSAQQERIYVKNENNWDAEHIYIERIEQTYNADASAVAAQLFLSGEIDGCDVDADLLDAWKADPSTAELMSPTRVTSDYSYFYTFNFEPRFDEEYEPDNWVVAVNTEDFRQAIFHGLNRQLLYQVGYPNNYNDLIMNTVSPSKSYINDGKDYVEYGDLAEITARDSYDAELAVEYMKKAIPEIIEAGGHFPIVMLIQYNGSTDWAQRNVLLEDSMKKLFNTDELKALAGGNDILTFHINNFGSQGFLTGTRRAGKYTIQECNWGADYSDPETWTDPFAVNNNYNFAYDTTNELGFNRKTPETMEIINTYLDMVAEAKKEYTDIEARYTKFADAEAYYINHAMVIPFGITGGGYQATKLNGFEGQYASYGQASSRYKGQHVYETAMSEEMFYDQLAKWEEHVGQ